jgi:RimJ/RimL family protein N-acetyltransferase
MDKLTFQSNLEKPKETIRLAQESDIKTLSEIYSRVFSEADPENPWDEDHSFKHLMYWFKIQPDMFFSALNENKELIGAIAVSIKPWRKGNRCVAGIIFVDSAKQKGNVGKELFKRMLEEAVKKYQTTSFEAVTFAEKEFPLSWYKKLGILPDEHAVLVKGPCLEILENLSKE